MIIKESKSVKCRHITMSFEVIESSGLNNMSANCSAKIFIFAYRMIIRCNLTLLLAAKKFRKIKIRRQVSACNESMSAKMIAIDFKISFSMGCNRSKF